MHNFNLIKQFFLIALFLQSRCEMEKRMPRACPPAFCPDPSGEMILQNFFYIEYLLYFYKVDLYKKIWIFVHLTHCNRIKQNMNSWIFGQKKKILEILFRQFAFPDTNRRLQSMLQQSEEMLKLVKANFTQTVAITRTELDNSNKDKDGFHLEAIRLRRDKAFLEEELNLYQKKCKEDFVDSLRGIPNVTKEFLKRIDDLFSKHISFQLTCDKQKNQLEDIRENCSSLSREVENKLQSYLNIVGNQFTKINGENAKYLIENVRLKEDADWCNQNRSSMIRENRKNLEQLQRKCDEDSEKLLLENRKPKGDNNLNENLLSVKEKEIKMLKSTIETLNTSLASCKVRLVFQLIYKPSFTISF